MRTILLVLFFALGLVAEPIPCEGGVISFNFGRVQKTGVLNHDFIISNPTEDNTVIESIKADCSCTSVISGDWLIKPGGQTRIECSLSAEGIRGKFKKEVSVQLASPDKLMFKLVLEGEVIPSIILSMDAIFITKIQRTAKIKKEISIMSGDGTALEIKRVHTKCDFISVGYKTNGKGQKLEVVLDGSLLPGDRLMGMEPVTIEFSGDRFAPETISVFWDVEPAIYLNPGRVNLSTTSPNSIVMIEAKNRSVHFEIVKVEKFGDFFEIGPLRKLMDGKHEVVVRLVNGVNAGYHSGRIKFQTTLDEQPEVFLRVTSIIEK